MKKAGLDLYLSKQGLNRQKVSDLTHISYTTLQRASNRECSDINPRVMIAIADAIGKTPGQVFDELIETEMRDHMTITTTKILFRKFFPNTLISVEELGDDEQAVMVEIDLKGGDDPIRVAVNFGDGISFNKDELLNGLKCALQSFECDDDNLFYADTKGVDDWIDVEQMGISEESAAYLYRLGADIGSEI